MTKTQLNINQIGGLAFILIGYLLNGSLTSQSSLFTGLGFLIFLMSSNISIGMILSVMVSFIGIVFTILHYGYGDILLPAGGIGIIIFSFIQYVYKNKALDIRLLYVSFLIYMAGIFLLFNKNYLGMVFLLVGLAAIVLSYSYRFYIKSNKNFEDYLKLALVYTGAFTSLMSFLHLPFALYVSTLFNILLFIWIIISLVREIKSMRIS